MSAAATVFIHILDQRGFVLLVLIAVTMHARKGRVYLCESERRNLGKCQTASFWIVKASSIPVFPNLPFGTRLPPPRCSLCEICYLLICYVNPPWIAAAVVSSSLIDFDPSVLSPQLRLPSSRLLSLCPSRGERTEMGKGLLDSLSITVLRALSMFMRWPTRVTPKSR